MNLLKLLQIIKEEVQNWFDDEDQSTLDTFSDKYLTTHAPATAPSTAPSQPKTDGELIGYVTREWSRQLPVPIPIYKNPENLIGIGINARGVLLNNGDFYLTPSASAMHINIISVLGEKGIISSAKADHYNKNFPKEFITVQRVAKTDTFSQSASYDKFPENYQEIFKIGTQKQPFRFIAFNMDETESPLDPNNLYSNIPQGYDANILYEKTNFF